MSKKLLAAALAAAFLATGGMARAESEPVVPADTDYVWDGEKFDTVVAEEEAAEGRATTISITAGSETVGNVGIYSISNTNSATVGKLTVGESATAGMTIGESVLPEIEETTRALTVKPIHLTATNFEIKTSEPASGDSLLREALDASVLVIGADNSLTTTGSGSNKSTIDAESALIVEGSYINAATTSGNSTTLGEVAVNGAIVVGAEPEPAPDARAAATNGLMTNAGKITFAAGGEESGNGGLINNGKVVNEQTGLIVFAGAEEAAAVYQSHGGSINNAATLGYADAGIRIDVNVSDGEDSSALGTLLTDIVAGGSGNVGTIVLTGTAAAEASPDVFRGITPRADAVLVVDANKGDITFDGTLSGLYPGGINVNGAELTIGENAGGLDSESSIYNGRNVTINQENAGIAGTITAYGGTSGEDIDPDVKEGSVIFNADGVSVADVNAGLLDVQADDATLTGAFSGDSVNIAGTNTFNNESEDLDLSGGNLTGTGTLNNSGEGVLTINKDTTFGSDASKPSIVNYDAETDTSGTIATDAGGLKNVASVVEIAEENGGFGTIEVGAGDLTGVDIDWGKAEQGTLNVNVGNADQTVSGNLNLGGGSVSLGGDTPGTGAITIAENSTITAKDIQVDADQTNKGTLTGGVTVADDVILNNDKTGTITVGKGGATDTLTVGEDSKIVNSGTLDIGKDTTFAGDGIAAGIDNTEGKITVDAGVDTDKLANAIDQDADSIGEIEVSGNLSKDLVFEDAKGGNVTLTGKQTGGKNVNVGDADLALTGEGNVMGDLTAGTLDLSSGTYGNVESTVGSITANGATMGDVTSNKDVILTDSVVNGALDIVGNLDATGSTLNGGGKVVGNFIAKNDEMKTYTGDFTYGEGDGSTEAYADIRLVHYKGLLTVDQDIKISNDAGTGSIFEKKITSVAGNILITGGTSTPHQFLDGVATLDVDGLNKYTRIYNNGIAAFAGTVDSNVVVESGSKLIVGVADDYWDITTAGDLEISAGYSIAVNKGGILSFTGDEYGAAYILSAEDNTAGLILDDNAYLTAERNLVPEVEQKVMDGSIFDTLVIGNDVDVTAADYEKFLSKQGHASFGNQGEFSFKSVDDGGDNGTYYTYYETNLDDQTSRENAMRDAGDSIGIGDDVFMNTDTTFDTIAGINNADDADELLGLVTSPDATSPNTDGLFVAQVLDGIGGQNRWGTGLQNKPIDAYTGTAFANGHDIAGSVEAVMDTVRAFNRAITSRAYNMGSLMGATEYDECGNIIDSVAGYKNRVWAGYTGQWDKLDRRGVDKGYKYDAHGLNIGYDHVTSSGVGFGAAFGYSRGKFENQGVLWNDSKIHNYSFGLVASYNHCSGFFTSISGTYTYSKYKMNSQWTNVAGARTDRADFHGDSWSVGGEIGYDFKPAQNFTITPTLGLYYYTTRTNRFDSTYRDGMKFSNHAVEMPFDVTAKYDIAVGCDSTFSLIANAGYAYNFHNKGVKISQFGITGTGGAEVGALGGGNYSKPGRSSWNVGGGAQFRYKNFDVGVHYEYYGRKDFRSHNLSANVGMSF